jgi:nitrous oxidase accessory protein NosD
MQHIPAVCGVIGAVLSMAAVPAALAATYRYASSSNRIYVEDGGTATLSSIKAALPMAPLDRVSTSPMIWLLRANLVLRDGSSLALHGSAVGGDTDELRLLSRNVEDGFVFISAEHGTLDIQRTRIRSWDPDTGGPDTEYATHGRAWIRVRSMLAADGVTPLESRMDIRESDIGYLGYAASEAYGLVWKVIGSAAGLYDKVQVRGDIFGSRIHHNYFGVYTYGHQDGVWTENEVDHNVQYGFDPHDDSDNLLIADNDVHDNGNHGIIASKRCDHVVIRGNRSWANSGNGIMLHRSSDDAVVEGNEAWLNADSGVALFAVKRAAVRDNVLLDNGKAGIRLSMGVRDSVVERNEIGHAGRYGLYFYRGSDTPEPGDDGRNRGNAFVDNVVHGSGYRPIKMSDSDATTFERNSFRDDAKAFELRRSAGTRFTANEFPADVEVRTEGTSALPGSTRFDRQDRVKVKVDEHSWVRFTDAGNAVFDPDETVYTSVTAEGSSLVLTAAEIGTTSTVHRRALLVHPQSGSVAVDPFSWNLGGDRSKRWHARASAAGSPIQFTVGDLVPGASYRAYADGVRIGTLAADSTGAISFADVPGTAGTVTYVVKP